MKLFLQTGIRLAELVGLGKSDLNLNNRSLFVRGKGAKERILPLTESTAEALRIQLEKRPPFIDDGGYISEALAPRGKVPPTPQKVHQLIEE